MLAFKCKSVTHLALMYVHAMKQRSGALFSIQISVVQAHCCKTFLSYWILPYLAPLSKVRWPLSVGPLPDCLFFSTDLPEGGVRWCTSSSLFLFPDSFGHRRSFLFLLQSQCVSFYREAGGVMIRIAFSQLEKKLAFVLGAGVP